MVHLTLARKIGNSVEGMFTIEKEDVTDPDSDKAIA